MKKDTKVFNSRFSPALRIASALLVALMVLPSCASGPASVTTEPPTDAVTDTTDVVTTEEPKVEVPAEPVVIDISTSLYDKVTEPTSTVTITEKVINTVNPLIFGNNMSWRFEGFGLWDKENNKPYDLLMDALKNSGITSFRWPAGIEGDYCHWYEMIGEKRVPQLDPFTSKNKFWGMAYKAYPYFGLEEFIDVCDQLGIPAVIQLNCGNGTPEEAADLVKYCVDNGFNVSSFCVGNEMHMGEEMIDGIKVTKKPAEYVDFYLKTYELLGDYADKVELGCVGLTDEQSISYFKNWDKEVLPALSDKIDFVDAHIAYSPYTSQTGEYTNEDFIKCYLASAYYIEEMIDQQLLNIDNYCMDNKDDITLQITEYGTLGKHSNSMAGAAFIGALLGVMTEEPRISSANHFSAILIYESSPTLVGYKWDGNQLKVFDNAMSYVFRWYSAQSGRNVLRTKVTCDDFSTKKTGLIPALYGAPTIYCNTYIDEKTGEGSIIIVNANYKKNEMTDITLPFGFEITDVAEVYSIDPLSMNSSTAKAVTEKHYTPEFTTCADGKLTVSTKPVSVVKIDFVKSK